MTWYYKLISHRGITHNGYGSSMASNYKSKLRLIIYIWNLLKLDDFEALEIKKAPGWELIERKEYLRLEKKYKLKKEE